MRCDVVPSIESPIVAISTHTINPGRRDRSITGDGTCAVAAPFPTPELTGAVLLSSLLPTEEVGHNSSPKLLKKRLRTGVAE
jgi:hypothetical protein